MTAHKPFKRVVLFARQHRANQNISETLARLVDYFSTKPSIDVCLDSDTAENFNMACPVLPRQAFQDTPTLILVVGGDGSLLSAARMAIHLNLPVLGINRGHLGFLTDISPNEFESALDQILQGQYIEESRALLKLQLPQLQHVSDDFGDALNDIVLSRGRETHLVRFDVYINDQFVSHYRSDGLIFSTPTGSTAYALSAGGPIMHPNLQAVVMVPMFSHSLSSRPLVIDAKASIRIEISEKNEAPLQISCDGHDSYAIEPGQHAFIEHNPKTLRLLHPEDYHYFETLRLKLGWGSKPEG